MPNTSSLILFLWPALLGAQNVITSAGYSSPVPASVAPGQVITLFVDGAAGSLTQPVRATAGSATTLGGISVFLRQFNGELVVPVIEVRPLSTCPSGSLPTSKPACASVAAVTVQIPYELIPLCPLCLRPISFPPPWLYVTVNGQPGAAFEVNPLADQIHILTSCDAILTKFGDPPPQNLTGLRCGPMVTHGNGSLVSASAPAQPGEPLTAWAVGLGYSDPPAVTGQTVASPRPVTGRLEIDFSFRPNALPVKPQPTVRIQIFPDPFAVYAGLAQGFVGLYQINFTAPAAPQGTLPCAPLGNVAQNTNAVQSNLTVSFGGGYSFDGAGICAATSRP